MVKNCIGPTKCTRYEESPHGRGCVVPPGPGYTSEWVSLEFLDKCPGAKIIKNKLDTVNP